MKKKNPTIQAEGAAASSRAEGFSLSSVLHNLKKYFLPWLIVSVLAAVSVTGLNIIFSSDVEALDSTISFNYTGIEEGLDPNGCEFDTNAIKSDQVVTEALTEMSLSADLKETVQNSIFIDGIVADSAIEKIIQYDSVYNASGTNGTTWMESMRDTSYHPTQYRVSFNYSNTGLSGDDAAALLNKILEKYQIYFFQTYGYSESISQSLLSVSDDDYDYLIALDMYSSSLSSLENYIDRIAQDDTSQFRSEVTGYSFTDLADALQLIRSVDIDTLTSYILNNGVISDKDLMVSYYEYRIDNLSRSKKNISERLTSVQESIESYQKDTIMVYESNTTTSSVTETSETYDNLIAQKIQLQSRVSGYEQQITDFEERLAAINKAKGNASEENREYVAERISALEEKIAKLTEDVKNTASDYYENVKFTNAFSVITPASFSLIQYVLSAVSESMRMIIIAELSLLTIYLFISIIVCFPRFQKKKAEKAQTK
ncbi:MAG: hypothetical protein IJ496_06175 [Ruminococcus sp.]|nr:hypothetical protein [Ruminococcus sp.]